MVVFFFCNKGVSLKVILYHKNCTDGLFSAYAFWLKFRDDAIYIPVAYKPIVDMSPQEALEYLFSEKNGTNNVNQENNLIKLKELESQSYANIDLYVADYAFPVEHFLYHRDVFSTVTVIDHHVTAIKEYTDKIPQEIINEHCHFALESSGAKLSYKYLFGRDTVPLVFELVSDRDLWTFKLPDTKTFHSGLKLLKFSNFSQLDSLVKFNYSYIVEGGSIIEKELAIRINKIIENSVEEINVKIGDVSYQVGIVNCFPDIASDLCNTIIKEQNYPIAISYHIGKEGRVTYSVRSKRDVDCSKIAIATGGGGHKQACGFSSDLDFLNNLLTSKQLEVLVYESDSFS